MKLFLDPLSPNTNFIMGALFSGGDPMAAARLLINPDETEPKKDEPAAEEVKPVVESEP